MGVVVLFLFLKSVSRGASGGGCKRIRWSSMQLHLRLCERGRGAPGSFTVFTRSRLRVFSEDLIPFCPSKKTLLVIFT